MFVILIYWVIKLSDLDLSKLLGTLVAIFKDSIASNMENDSTDLIQLKSTQLK
jgi:hypothetical protein